MIRQIKSKDNAFYGYMQSLHKPAFSRKENAILIEGFRQVEEALAEGLEINCFVYTPAAQKQNGWSRIEPWWEQLQQTDCVELSDHLFKQISATKQPQGVALICKVPVIREPSILPSDTGLYMLLEAVQDPGNLGTIIRIADAFNFDGVLLTSGCVWPYYDKALRSAMGSVFHVPIYSFNGVSDCRAWLKQSGITIIAADPAAAIEIGKAEWKRPACIMIGNEGRGLSQEALELSDLRVGIPMPGRAESLNAAAAAAILAYEMMIKQ
jgi:TrmH family RNA methyltransferase